MANWRFCVIIEGCQWRVGDFVPSWRGVNGELAVLSHHREESMEN